MKLQRVHVAHLLRAFHRRDEQVRIEAQKYFLVGHDALFKRLAVRDYFFPRLLVEFIGRHKGVVLNFTVHNREGLLAQMAANLADLAIMVRPPQDPGMVSEAFAPHPYVIVAAPGHALVSQRNINMARLLQELFVVREKGSDTWHSMQEGFGEQMARLKIAMEIKSTETIKQAVMAGMGIGFLSAHTIGKKSATAV